MAYEASFGQWLCSRRRALRLQRTELAAQVGCAAVTLRKIETDERRPSHQLAELLADRLGIAPPDRATFVRVARGELPADFLPALPLPAPGPPSAVQREAIQASLRTNLPAPATSFVGRVAELAAVRELLARPGVRLLTLSGPGGSGKTRLALQAVGELAQLFADGIWFVDLAPLRDPALVGLAVAEALGLRVSGARPVAARLKEHLRDQQALLIFDNLEHLLEAMPLAGELLEAAPQLKILATSRAALRLRGEWNYPVAPLAAPGLRQPLDLAQQAAYDAVQLFVERAKAVRAGFALTPANAPAVTAICHKLDGLPLAIELAAARLRARSPEQIVHQLDQRLALLTGGPRDAPARQRTLRDTIDWSYDLLPSEQQALLQRLAVCVGGSTLAGAQAVGALSETAEASNSPTQIAMLQAIEGLIEHSLLRQSSGADGAPRFHMLETIREYALERLAASGQAEATRLRHANYFVMLAEAAEPHLYGAGQREWLGRLEEEHDNLRAALAWAIEHDRPTGLRLAGALGWFWHLHGHHREGHDWLLKALEQPQTGMQVDRYRAKALNQAGYLALWLNDLAQANALLDQSVAIWRKMSEPRGLAHALCDWGAAVSRKGNLSQARTLLEESISVFRCVGETQGLVRALLWHGGVTARQGDFTIARISADETIRLGREIEDISNVAAATGAILGYIAFQQGDYTAAQFLQEEHARLMREVDDKPGFAFALGFLGCLAYVQGQYERAKPLLEERLLIWRALGSQYDIAWSLYFLGYLALRQNHLRRATMLFAEGLALWRELDSTPDIARCLAGLAKIADAAKRPYQAALLLALTKGLLESKATNLEEIAWYPSSGYPITSQADYDQHVLGLRAELGDEAFAAAWAAGQAMTLDQALAEALRIAQGLAA